MKKNKRLDNEIITLRRRRRQEFASNDDFVWIIISVVVLSLLLIWGFHAEKNFQEIKFIHEEKGIHGGIRGFDSQYSLHKGYSNLDTSINYELYRSMKKEERTEKLNKLKNRILDNVDTLLLKLLLLNNVGKII